MVGYSFQRIFVEDIRSGAKRQTIRAPRKRHAREGERLQLFCGMRQPGCFRIIDDPLCVGLDEVRIDLRGLDNITGSRRRDGLIVVNGIPLIGDAAEHYARGDGFRAFDAIESIGHPAISAFENMIRFWSGRYGFKLFDGVAIRWDPQIAPWLGGDTPSATPQDKRSAA